jgi:probable F420-dependent oxidoreductase
MLELAATRTAGTHPYNVTPEHTAIAREAVGAASLVLPEQTVALTTDADTARRLARTYLGDYLGLPNYVNNWRRLGFTDDDFAADGSDRLIDTFVAHGTIDSIMARLREHLDAGADQVAVQPLALDGGFPAKEWQQLAEAFADSSPR